MKKILPLAILWVVVSILLIAFRTSWNALGADTLFIGMANTLLFLITIAGFVIVSGKSSSSNAHVFMRGVYISFLLKMFVIVTALFIFISIVKDVNKPAIFVSMGLYIVYSGIEVFQLMKLTRNQKNE